MKQYWDDFVDHYSSVEQNPCVFALNLINMLKLDTADHVLDAGCGPGMILPIMLERVKGQITSIDFSDKILEAASKRVPNNNKWKGEIGDVQQLCFADNTFDRYYSNCVLHLIPNPDQALKEAYRVLRPGGMIGFTVWGRRENSNVFTVMSDHMKPSDHDSFKLGSDPKSLKVLLIKLGFQDILMWYQQIAYDRRTVDDFLGMLNPRTLSSIENLELYRSILEERIQQNNILGQPFFSESLIVIAYK